MANERIQGPVAKRVSVSFSLALVAVAKCVSISYFSTKASRLSLGIVPLLILFSTLSFADARAREPELHPRAGLPHLAALTRESTGELRVAYLGGSITAAANGWRTLTTNHLRTLFPKRTVVEIDAGLPGTGSNLGACRLGYDVLRHRPDLLFVEFAVNDTGVPPDRIERTIEGIVRQTHRANPQTDLCFVYTVSTPGLPDLEAGNFPSAARAMETVAAHYEIPSIHLGVEIARRVVANELDFKNPAAPNAERTFSLDGVHPTAAGHRIYFDVIARCLPRLLRSETHERFVSGKPSGGPSAHPEGERKPAGVKPAPQDPQASDSEAQDSETRTRFATPNTASALPPPLHADNWENASLLLADAAHRVGDWTLVPLDDPNLRGSTKMLLPPTWRAEKPGSVIEFTFVGTRFGLLGIAAPDSGEFRVTIDDYPPGTATFFDGYVTPTFCRQREWFLPHELTDGTHHARIELLASPVDKIGIKAAANKPIDDPAAYLPQRLTLCGALVVGSNPP